MQNTKSIITALTLGTAVLLSGCATQNSLKDVAQKTSMAQHTANESLALAQANARSSQMAISDAAAAQSTALQALSAAHRAQRQADRDGKMEQRMFKKSMMK